MSDKHINDGGPAFPGQWYDFQPLTGEQVVREQWEGMTLRDYFAAKAKQAIRSGPEWQLLEMKEIAASNGIDLEDVIAHFAYKQADAMLRAREVSND